MSDLLFIYDADDWPRKTVREDAAVTIGVTGGVSGLRKELDRLLSAQKKFGRVAFNTHGESGQISFSNGSYIDAISLDSFRRYSGLFSPNTRIYFGGCKVAEGEEGWKFLEAAANVFLNTCGGVTFAYTSDGIFVSEFWSNVAFFVHAGLFFKFRGHMVHPSGDARYVHKVPGQPPVRSDHI